VSKIVSNDISLSLSWPRKYQPAPAEALALDLTGGDSAQGINTQASKRRSDPPPKIPKVSFPDETHLGPQPSDITTVESHGPIDPPPVLPPQDTTAPLGAVGATDALAPPANTSKAEGTMDI